MTRRRATRERVRANRLRRARLAMRVEMTAAWAVDASLIVERVDADSIAPNGERRYAYFQLGGSYSGPVTVLARSIDAIGTTPTGLAAGVRACEWLIRTWSRRAVKRARAGERRP
jgi:hypothetical protein